MEKIISKAATLLEALPYIQRFRSQIFVVKYGGSFMDSPDAEVRHRVARDVVFLEAVGINPVVVHGGGKTITRALEKASVESKFVQGHRVTDAVSGGRVEAANIDVAAEDFTWPSRGPARVRVSTDAAGGRVSAHGTVDAGPQRANLTVTARKVDLAMAEPWLPPAAGRVRGIADADVTLALGLAPLSVEAKGSVAGGNLVWTDGVRPQVHVARLDVSAEDVTWPSRGPARVRMTQRPRTRLYASRVASLT